MRIDILTIFPDMFAGVLNESILRIAREKGLVEFHLHNIRNWTEDRHKSVDDRPYGGGPGMVMKPEPIFRAVEEIAGEPQEAEKILLSPQGEVFSQKMASELAARKRLIFICGRYEGFDERIRLGLAPREISLGDFVLAGGEVAAMAIIEAVVRLLPGVLGDEDSAKYESFSSHTGEAKMLDYPQYTRPPVFRGMRVPEVLLSGNHEKIRKWRESQALKKTKTRRKDLLDKK